MTGSALRMVHDADAPALPIDYETEQALLSALLVNDTVYDRVDNAARHRQAQAEREAAGL